MDTGYSTIGGANAAPNEPLTVRIEREIGMLADVAVQLNGLADRIYGSIPMTADSAGAKQVGPTTLADHVSDLNRVRRRLADASARLTSGL